MTFSFNQNIPAANNDPADDQPLMLQNNLSTFDIIEVDHVGFNTVNGGYHSQVTFSANQSAPGFGTGVSDLFVNAVSGISELFFQNSAGTQQLTGQPIINGSLTGIHLASGLKIVYSTILSFSSSGSTFTLPFAFTTGPAVIACPEGSSSNFSSLSTTSTTTTVTVYSQLSGTNGFLIAIGI